MCFSSALVQLSGALIPQAEEAAEAERQAAESKAPVQPAAEGDSLASGRQSEPRRKVLVLSSSFLCHLSLILCNLHSFV